jgi:O-antigen/teichoic acid export membrane protein
MVIARKIAYNVAVSSISKVLATGLALVSIGFITRYLGKDGFGDYATVLAFLSFFAAIGDLGLYSISTREISRDGADEEKIMGNIFTLRIVTSLLVLFISPIIVLFFPYSTEVKEAIVIVAASYLFSSTYQVLNGVFQKNLAMDKVAISELLGKIIQMLVIILAIKMKLGFNWIISSLLFYMIFSFFLVYFWSKRYIKIKFRMDLDYWKKFLKESYPLGIAVFITFIYFKIDTIMLSIMKSSSDVGIYNAAYKVIENITFFPSMLVGLIFPIMAQHIFTDFSRFKEVSNKTFKVFVLTVVPLIVGTMFLSKGIVGLIGGSAFLESAPVLQILVFALAMIFFGNFFNAVLIAGNLQKKLMLVLAFAAAFNVVANLVLIPKFSYFGSAFVSVATEMIVVVATFYLSYKKLKYVPSLTNFFSILTSGFAMAVFLFVFRGHSFIFEGLGGIVVYIFFLWIFKAVKTEEITSIISKKGIKEYETIS